MQSNPGAIAKPIVAFVLVVVWLSFFTIPFMASQGQRDGIFVTSPEWDAHVPWAILQGTAVGLAALVGALGVTAICLAAVLGEKAEAIHPAWRPVFITTLCLFLLSLPFWGWGFERSFLRVWSHQGAQTLGEASTEATVTSYYVTKQGRRSRRKEVPHLHLRVPDLGRIEVNQHPPFKDGFEPENGASIKLVGRRTWVGVYYDTVQWPEEWLAQK